jgi:DNA-binding SARP family transcriptional activator/tetratricopeptide (TPR) repeat protein
MYFRVLGPVEIWERDQKFSAGTFKEQCLLAILLLEAGRVVSVQTLAERLWDDQIPDHARETLQVYVSRLRRSLREAGDRTGLISSSPAGGYRLDVPPDQVDVRRFERLLSSARASAAKPNPERTRTLLREAEGLWAGEPLEGLTGQWAQATRQSLRERLRAAILARSELDLHLDEYGDEIISELTALTGTGRIDQRATGLLMRALNSAGRQDEALAIYRRTRTRLREELGADPHPELEAMHQRILHGDSTIVPSDAPSAIGGPAPDTLDRDLTRLIGRDAELRELLTGVTEDLRVGKSTAVFAIDGMPGVGKSALAIHAAHRLRSHCPDGILQINLRTHHPHQPPVDPREALTRLLEAISTPAGELGRAGSVDALAALWRRRNNGRRLLILLDDVLDAEQISSLLPATPGSIVLLTSRRRISGLAGARQHTIRPLADDAARILLTQITGRDFSAHHDQLARFTRCCGGLPLAVAVAAAHLRARPAWELNDIVERLTTTVVSAADDSLTTPIRAAFAMSYRALTPDHRMLLRRLAAHPGDDIGWHAAAILASAPLSETDLALDVLVEHHLIEETLRHRYRLHDLLRAYALNQVKVELDTAASDDAVGCMLEFYTASAARAESLIRPYRRALGEPLASSAGDQLALDSPTTAQAWMDDESANLMAAVAYARERGWSRHASHLPYILAQHLDRRGHWSKAVEMLRDALQVVDAQQGEARNGTVSAQLMTDLAAAHVRTGDLDAALSAAQTAFDAWSACGDERGQADVLIELGRIHWHARRSTTAAEAYARAVAIFGRIGYPRGQAVAGYHMGIVLFELGDSDAALIQTREALKTARLLNDPVLQCDVLANLGEMYRLIEEHDKALHYFEQAQTLADRQGNPHNIAILASNIGAIYDHTGDYQSALKSFGNALRLFQAVGDRRNEVDVLLHLARAYTRTRDYDASLAQIERATLLAEQLRDPLRHARVCLETGHLRLARSQYPSALEFYGTSLAYAQQAAAPLDQAHAYQALGDVLLAMDDPVAAREHWNRARSLYRQLGHRNSGPATA